jgi:hypothetical protein
MSVSIEVEDARGEAVAFDGQFLSIRLPKAFAPGQPLVVKFADTGAPIRLEGRSVGSKRLDDGQFEVRLRLVSARREHQGILDSLRR